MATRFNDYLLRLVTPADLTAYYNLIENNRRRLEDFFAGTVAVTQTLGQTKQHLEEVIAKVERKEYFSFIVTDLLSDKLIASVQIKNIDWNIPKAEIGYYIDQSFEGKGIISKATALVVDYGFNELGMRKLYIRTAQRNLGSRKVAERNGFTLEGIIRCDYKTTAGEIVDLLHYGRLHPDFEGAEDA